MIAYRDIMQAQQLVCVQRFGNVKDLGLFCHREMKPAGRRGILTTVG